MAKKAKCPEFENHERWLVSYADMLTLLFAVFVVLFALKDGGEPEVQKAAGSMQESFNTPLEDIPVDRQKEAVDGAFGIFENHRGSEANRPDFQQRDDVRTRIRMLEEEMEKLKQTIEERLYGPSAFRPLDEKGNSRIVSIERTERGFKLTLLSRLFFEEGAFEIKKSALATLDKVIPSLMALGRNITVEGHTDSAPAAKGMNNWDISALRATHLLKYMVEKHHFPETRLSAAGFGDTRPIAHNGTEEGRMMNRRVEIHVHYDEEKDPLR